MEVSTHHDTATLLTYFQAWHAAQDGPKIFDDFQAYSPLTEEERDFFDRQFATAIRIIDPAHASSCPGQETAPAWFMRAITPLSWQSAGRDTRRSLRTSGFRLDFDETTLAASREKFDN